MYACMAFAKSDHISLEKEEESSPLTGMEVPKSISFPCHQVAVLHCWKQQECSRSQLRVNLPSSNHTASGKGENVATKGSFPKVLMSSLQERNEWSAFLLC